MIDWVEPGIKVFSHSQERISPLWTNDREIISRNLIKGSEISWSITCPEDRVYATTGTCPENESPKTTFLHMCWLFWKASAQPKWKNRLTLSPPKMSEMSTANTTKLCIACSKWVSWEGLRFVCVMNLIVFNVYFCIFVWPLLIFSEADTLGLGAICYNKRKGSISYVAPPL